MVVECKKESNGYVMWNTKNFKVVDIKEINSYSLVGGGRKEYRVDVGGVTIASKVSLTEAKKKAKEYLR